MRLMNNVHVIKVVKSTLIHISWSYTTLYLNHVDFYKSKEENQAKQKQVTLNMKRLQTKPKISQKIPLTLCEKQTNFH